MTESLLSHVYAINGVSAAAEDYVTKFETCTYVVNHIFLSPFVRLGIDESMHNDSYYTELSGSV